jgi:predicted dehydrogenase
MAGFDDFRPGMSDPLRYGLIGVGGVGGVHLSALAALESQGLAKLVAVADPSLPQLNAQKERLEARGVRWHLDYRGLFDAGQPLDAVVIATPIPLHLKMTGDCLRQGLAVYLEKPPVPLIQQLETLIAEDAAERVAVGFQMITAPAVQTLKQLMMSGELGEVREFRVSACWPRWNRYYERAAWAGKMALHGEPVFDGPATNALSHLIHNVMYLASASADGFETPVEIQAELYRVRPIESYDVACLRGRFESGAVFTVALTHATEELRKYRLEARGSRGWARISEDGALLETHAGTRSFDSATPSAMVISHTDFAEFLQGRRQRPATRLRDVRGFLRTTNGALISSGQIHAIPAECQRTYGVGDALGYEVPGLAGLMDGMFEQGLLFSETGVRWAVRTAPVDVRDLSEIDFESYAKSS